MYLRFISPWPSYNMKNVNDGIFQALIKCRDEGLVPGYLLEPALKEFEWFKQELPSPDEHNFIYAGHAIGICWFRSDAKVMIRRARRIAALLAEGDVWITVSRTDNPGIILYRDDYQIIAKPTKQTPVQWG